MRIFRPQASRWVRATRTMVEESVLARFSGPVALVSPDGAVISANAAAAPIQAMLGAGAHRLAAAIAEASATGKDCSVSLIAPADGEENRELTLSILPLGKGEAALVIGSGVPLAVPALASAVAAHQRYKDLLSLAADFAWETNAAGIFTSVSEDGAFGWPAEAMLGRCAAEFLAENRAGVDPFRARVPVSGISLAFRRADGGSTLTSVAAMPVLGHDSTWLGTCGVAREESAATLSLPAGTLVRLDDRPAVPKQAVG